MKNLLNEELTLTWGPHHYEQAYLPDVLDGHARAEIAFGTAGEEGDDMSTIIIHAEKENDEWCISHYQKRSNRPYHNDIYEALCGVFLDELIENY